MDSEVSQQKLLNPLLLKFGKVMSLEVSPAKTSKSITFLKFVIFQERCGPCHFWSSFLLQLTKKQ